MFFSPHSLHASVISSLAHKASVRTQILAHVLKAPRRDTGPKLLGLPKLAAPGAPAAPPPDDMIAISLPTVSLATNFDAYIGIQFQGADLSTQPTMLVLDSGNSMLIVPRWEDIIAINGWYSSYTILGTTHEPWGCPVNIVRGPIQIPTSSGDLFLIPDCVFYACTADNPDTSQEPRTANFGAACLNPWTSSGWNTPSSSLTLMAPLAYNTAYPYARFTYAVDGGMFGAAGTPTVTPSCTLTLSKNPPTGVTWMNILPNEIWMTLTAQSLSIAGKPSVWPGKLVNPLAVIDTGGGPIFLSDPNGTIYNSDGNDAAVSPGWISASTNCQCIRDAIDVTLTDGNSSVSYVVDTSARPRPARGLTLVMCEINSYMSGCDGMNIGGVSFLFNDLVIDYVNARLALIKKT